MARYWRAIALAAGVALGILPAQAQTPAKPAAKATPAPQFQPQGRVYYDSYQASQRQRLRRESCMRDEDLQAQYCVKKCRAQYVIANGRELPRQCRSAKPLPPGQLPTANQVQKGTVAIPAKPARGVAGN
ncbi:MAG: hypothetical protein ACRET8_04880 [Burkholderiales bacterium]